MNNVRQICAVLLLSTLFFPLSVSAEEDVWFYRFHLEWKNGALMKSADVEYFYDIAPYGPETSPETGEYYAEVVSGKGASLVRTWFNEPTLIVASKNKKVLELMVPYFANANTVTFYTKDGVKQFSESVSGASFCDEDSVCEKEVGEDYSNCRADCPAPIIPSEPQTPNEARVSPPATSVDEPSSAPAISKQVESDEVRREQSSRPQNSVIPLTIGVVLVLTAVLGLVYRKRMQS